MDRKKMAPPTEILKCRSLVYIIWAMGFIIISSGQNDDVIRQKSKIDLHFIETYFINANELAISRGNDEHYKKKKKSVKKTTFYMHSLCWWTTSFVVIGFGSFFSLIFFFVRFHSSFDSFFEAIFVAVVVASLEHNDDFTALFFAAHDITECDEIEMLL